MKGNVLHYINSAILLNNCHKSLIFIDSVFKPSFNTMTTVTIDRTTFEACLGQKISKITISSGSNKSDGVAGSLKTVVVTTTSGNTHTLVVKLLPTENPSILNYLVNCRVMESENEFYGSILQELKAILKQHKLDPDLLPFPKHFGGTDAYCIMEDLRPAGYKMADKFQGLNWQQVSLTMSALAKLHATTYYYIRQEGEKVFHTNDIRPYLLHFPWNAKGMDPKYYKDTISMYLPMVDIMKQHNEQLGLKLKNLVPQFLSLFTGIFDKTDKEYFPVICHGDLWLNNILFKATNYGNIDDPAAIKFIDLQQAHRGNIFEDLVYFFGASTTPAFREKYLLRSLEIYHQSFTKMIKELGCPTPIGFSLGFLIQNFYKNLKTLTIFAGPAISMQLIAENTENSHGDGSASCNQGLEERDMESIVIHMVDPKDLAPAGSDYAEMGEFCRESILSEPRALKRFYDIIEEMDRLGVFDDKL